MRKLLVFFLLLYHVSSWSQNTGPTITQYISADYNYEIEKATGLVEKLMHDKKIPGLSICVSTSRKTLWIEGFGYADLENKKPVTITTMFRIGSLSKTFTAVGLMRLMEKDKIRLKDNVRKYVPDFPEKKYPITIGELASHTSGIRDYRKNEFISNVRYNSVRESLSIFKDDSLLFEPGTKYSYATYNYVLLSAAIENAANKNFLQYMKDEVFIPLELKNTMPDYNDSMVTGRTKFYDEKDGNVVSGIVVDNSNKWGGGGFLSTPYDLVKMAKSLLNHDLLWKSSVKKMWTPYKLANGQSIKYGIGWIRDMDSLHRSFLYHGGSSIGGRSFLLVYPNNDLIIAVTCNISTSFDQAFVMQVANVFIKQ
ncbi:MAG: serine hydrolase domain-containing protein [Chitinophagaceae bacterium]